MKIISLFFLLYKLKYNYQARPLYICILFLLPTHVIFVYSRSSQTGALKFILVDIGTCDHSLFGHINCHSDRLSYGGQERRGGAPETAQGEYRNGALNWSASAG
jgi:hypothetical protein